MSTPPSVLVVDDDRELLESYEMASEGAPFRFRFAAGADEALAVAEAEPLDIVVVDYWIPGPRDGIDLLKEFGERWPSTNQVLISGAPPVGVDRLANVQILLKPCRFDELLATLTQTARRRHAEGARTH